MITTCTECQARYQLDAEKIPPRVIKVRCPSCGGVFSLDGSLARNQIQKEEVQPQVEQPVASEPAATVPETPAPVAQTPAPVAQTPVVPEPVAKAPAASMPAAPEPVAPASSDPAVKESPVGVAVMDRPVPSSSRRRRSKEEMLARALVSDIMVYNQDLYDRAKAEGNLLEALGSEIKKSWELYKEKVTPEVANSTNHFRDALNEILADGEKLF